MSNFYGVHLRDNEIEEFLKELFKSNNSTIEAKITMICSFFEQIYKFELNIMQDMINNYAEMCSDNVLTKDECLHSLFFSIQEKYEFISKTIEDPINHQPKVNTLDEYSRVINDETEILTYVRQKLYDINILDVKLKELEESHINIFFSSNSFKATSLEDLKHLIVKHIMYFTLIGFINMVFECNKFNTIHYGNTIISLVLNKYLKNESLTRDDMYNISQEIISLCDHYKDMI
jgi:hypothetical protein